jgi:hydroxymethylglutaryl-CoA lyase
MSSLPRSVRIVEMAPRDGLQNEPVIVSTADKVELIALLGKAGLTSIESAAFVSPKWVPKMADSSEVMKLIERLPGVTYPVLTPNQKGLDGAIAANAQEIAVFGSASEAFSQANINCSIDEILTRSAPLVEQALANGMKARGYISCVLGCPYEGDVDPTKVLDVARRLKKMGCYEIVLSDTIGTGTPEKAAALVNLLLPHISVAEIAIHFHDTYGQALANVYACMELGVSVVDASVAGLGGCPYAKGASGNLATEDLLYMLDGMGIETGVSMEGILDASAFISGVLGRPPVSRAGKALLTKRGY